jgi:hypothetical protein
MRIRVSGNSMHKKRAINGEPIADNKKLVLAFSAVAEI